MKITHFRLTALFIAKGCIAPNGIDSVICVIDTTDLAQLQISYVDFATLEDSMRYQFQHQITIQKHNDDYGHLIHTVPDNFICEGDRISFLLAKSNPKAPLMMIGYIHWLLQRKR
jgi:hypothetical protein